LWPPPRHQFTSFLSRSFCFRSAAGVGSNVYETSDRRVDWGLHRRRRRARGARHFLTKRYTGRLLTTLSNCYYRVSTNRSWNGRRGGERVDGGGAVNTRGFRWDFSLRHLVWEHVGTYLTLLTDVSVVAFLRWAGLPFALLSTLVWGRTGRRGGGRRPQRRWTGLTCAREQTEQLRGTCGTASQEGRRGRYGRQNSAGRGGERATGTEKNGDGDWRGVTRDGAAGGLDAGRGC